MIVVRVFWCLLAAAAAAFAAWTLFAPVEGISLGCSKTGSYSDSWPDVRCSDAIFQVLGVWPSVWLGVLLAAPSVVAALAMRVWMSWVAVIAYGGLAFYGLAHIDSFWWQLVIAIGFTIAALVLALVHLVAE